MTALIGTWEQEKSCKNVDPYLAKGIKQKAGILNLIHLVGAGGEPFDGGKRVHPDCLGRGTCENTAKCFGGP